MGHHLELDDGHILGHVHPGATVIPAAFALAEARQASGRDLLTAIVAGYEVVIRVGRGIAASAMYDRGFHGPGLFGAFGAAAAAAAVLRLDPERAAHAIGNCCLTPAATFQAFTEGAGIKDLYCGWPAMVGTLAAQLAAAGISGPRLLFEGKLGLARAVADRHDLGSITADLGQAWLLPTAYIKRHSACSFAHAMHRRSSRPDCGRPPGAGAHSAHPGVHASFCGGTQRQLPRDAHGGQVQPAVLRRPGGFQGTRPAR